MTTARYRAFKIVLSANDAKEAILRLVALKDILPPKCLADEANVPDVSGLIPAHMRPIKIHWGNGTTSPHFVYRERLLLRKNKVPIAKYFEDIGAKSGTILVVQQLNTFEFAICELVEI